MDREGLRELEGETEDDKDELNEGDRDGEIDGLKEDDKDGLNEGDNEGDIDGEYDPHEVNIIQDKAPSSLFSPVQVLVAVPAVVYLAVVNLKAPASASISSVQLAQVLSPVSVSPAATAINPPPVAIVVEPVVRASETSMSVDWSPPSEVGEVLAPYKA